MPAEDAPGGLQVKLRNGGWADVVPPTGSFVVNIGDLMAVWTNDRRVSHLHRVANPPVTAGRSSLQCWGSLCSPPTCA